MKKILHISSNFGGGLVTALHGYVENTPQHQHYLLAAKRAGYHDDMAWAARFAGQFTLPNSPLQAPLAIRKIYQQVKPDWVHLHSSFAGGYGRIALLPRSKVIYTPHCYAFERKDISPAMRGLYLAVEQLLSLGGGITAAISPREALLAQNMLMPQHIVLVPNVPIIPDAAFAARARHQRGEKLKIAMVGRLCPQKDPDFYIAAVKLAQARKLPVEFLWLGGGEESWTQQLKALGVTPTGWLSHGEILDRMAGCDVYFHTAAWESGPLSVLEAARLGLTLVCRGIPAVATLPVQPNIASPAEAVEVFAALAAGQAAPGYQTINAVLNERYSATAQRDALLELYGGTSQSL